MERKVSLDKSISYFYEEIEKKLNLVGENSDYFKNTI